MWSLFGTSVRRAWWTCVKGPHPRILSAGCAGGPRLTARLRCSRATTVRSSTVDPELEEEFVFLDSTGETPEACRVRVNPANLLGLTQLT